MQQRAQAQAEADAKALAAAEGYVTEDRLRSAFGSNEYDATDMDIRAAV